MQVLEEVIVWLDMQFSASHSNSLSKTVHCSEEITTWHYYYGGWQYVPTTQIYVLCNKK